MKRALLYTFVFLIVGMMLFLSACGKDNSISKPEDSSDVSEIVSETVNTNDTSLDTTVNTTSGTSIVSFDSSADKTNPTVSPTKKLTKEEQEKLKGEMNKIIDELMGDE